jgi:NAD(P)-dependent dehydrogenase (short-subunit alcohol dehydrogenase family)
VGIGQHLVGLFGCQGRGRYTGEAFCVGVETDMSNFARTEEGRGYALGMQALQRVAQPDDIAGGVAFLASDAARWITGDTVAVDSGSKL